VCKKEQRVFNNRKIIKNKKEVTKCEVNVCNEKCKMKRGSKKTLRVEHFRCKLFLMLFLPNSFKKFNFRDLKED
jgi:hypothetical protein